MKTKRALVLLISVLPGIEGLASPAIDYHPRGQTVLLHQHAPFGVIARGAPPLAYQWRKDGLPIPGATNDQFLIRQPAFSDEGAYSVIVSDASGEVTSAAAQLLVSAPAAGDPDCSFACGGVINDGIDSLALQPDGKVLIGGVFSKNIARLNADGTTDHAFVSGVSVGGSRVFSVALQNDGRVLIGGGIFRTSTGVTRNRIARLNADGTLDTAFQNGLAGANDYINSIAVQSDGKVLIAGGFTTVNGVARNRIARLNTDGTLDNTFMNGLAGANNYVTTVAVQTDGKVLIVGGFTTVNGVGRNRIARLNADGTLDATFQNGLSGANNWVHALTVQPDGKVLVGGEFTTINGAGRNGIARLNSDGTLDTGFLNGLTGPNGGPGSIAVQSDGKVVIAGDFTAVNGVPRIRIARLNADGTLDTAFQNGLSGVDNIVHEAVVQSDGKVVIGGFFTRVNGVIRTHNARLNADGTLDASFQNDPAGANNSVNSVALQNDGKLLIGGYFTIVDGMARNRVARINQDGTLDTSFQNGLSGANDTVNAVAVQSDGKTLIGGYFTTVNGVVRNRIARLNTNGTLDTSFQNGLAGANDFVSAIAVQSDGKVLIGGFFTSVNGVTRNRIARLNVDGTLDTTFQNGLSGADNTVITVAVQSDGKVLLGGGFRFVNNFGRSRVARVNSNGTVDQSFQAGTDSSVHSIAVQNDGKVLIGGLFTTVNETIRRRIARLNSDGTVDEAFDAGLTDGSSPVGAITLLNDGRVLGTGNLTNANSVARNGVARFNTNGSLDTRFRFSGSFGVSSIALQSDGKLLVGGAVRGFGRLWGNPLAYIESLTRPNPESAILKLRLATGSTNRVQFKTNLNDPAWSGLPGDVIAAGPAFRTNKLDSTVGDAPQRFYRVTLLP